MKSIIKSCFLSSLLLSSAAMANVAEYRFDTVHTQILFFVKHLGFSNSQGEFLQFTGQFQFDKDDWAKSSVEVVIDTNSIDMDNDKWNEHMKNEDFFHVEKYPHMTFKSTKVVSADNKTGQIHGDLTILNETKPVVLDVVFNREGVHPYSQATVAGFSATTSLKRADWGMKYAIPGVSNDVELRIEVEGIKQQQQPGPR